MVLAAMLLLLVTGLLYGPERVSSWSTELQCPNVRLYQLAQSVRRETNEW